MERQEPPILPSRHRAGRADPADARILVRARRPLSSTARRGGDGVSLDGVEFASDEKPAKKKARAMLRLAEQVNSTLLAQVPSRAEPRVGRGMLDLPPRAAVAEVAADDAVRDRQRRDGGRSRGRALPASCAPIGCTVGPVQFRRVGDQRARPAAGGEDEEPRRRDRHPRDERRVLPEVGGDRLQLAELHLAAGEREKALRPLSA